MLGVLKKMLTFKFDEYFLHTPYNRSTDIHNIYVYGIYLNVLIFIVLKNILTIIDITAYRSNILIRCSEEQMVVDYG